MMMEGDTLKKELTFIVSHPCEILRHAIASLLQQHGYQVLLLIDSSKPKLQQLRSLHADIALIHYSQYEDSGFIRRVIDNTGAKVALLASSDLYHKDSYQYMIELSANGVTGFLDMNEAVTTFFS
jgi:DNA-binding NarL/FixJ family response regulator